MSSTSCSQVLESVQTLRPPKTRLDRHMKRILILDDDNDRHDWFRGEYPRAYRQHVWTVKQALWALEDPKGWDTVFLDHDLEFSHPTEYDPDTESGLVVANYIARLKVGWSPRCKFVIHSWNPERSRLMYDVLVDSGLDVCYNPFRWRDDREWTRKFYRRAWPEVSLRPSLPWER